MQEAIAVSTTPPLPGLQMVQQVNAALQTIATDFAGPNDPAALAGPYMTWADTANLMLKRRNAAGSDWMVEGVLFENNTQGRLLNIRTYGTPGVQSYTATAGTRFVIIEGTGAGGAGGGAPAFGAAAWGAGAGGNSGSSGWKKITTGFSGVSITIGAPGIGVTGANGGNGGATSFGALMSLPGGTGGNVGVIRTAANSPSSSAGPNGLTTGPSGADRGQRGAPGLLGFAISNAFSGTALGGAGGEGPYGSAGPGRLSAGTTALDGYSASGNGAGGGGAIGINNGAPIAGGDGAPGLLIIYEYA